MYRELDNKVVLITGGGSGIGRATARLFARHKANVVIADVDETGGRRTVQTIEREGGRAVFFKTDVSDGDQVQTLVNRIMETYGQLDCAHNNAGILGDVAYIDQCTEENWDRVIDTNLKGVWWCLKYELVHMVRQGQGCIVNTSSILGLLGADGLPAYIAAKHGINGLTKAAWAEYGNQGIRVNAVCPFAVRTPMQAELSGKPVGSPPGRVAEIVVWLCTDAASRCNGETLTSRDWRKRMRNPDGENN